MRPESLKDKKILAVFAHPDDEIIFGWPLILSEGPVELLICSSDENNPNREWCSRRKEALAEVCATLGIEHTCLPFESEFYRRPHRPENKLQEVFDAIASKVVTTDADFIFTHNSHGEYGHIDHRLVHQWVVETARVPVIYTDIFVPLNWPWGMESTVLRDRFSHRIEQLTGLMTHSQAETIETCKSIYHRHGCWTWDFPIPQEASLFRTRDENPSGLRRGRMVLASSEPGSSEVR